MNEIFEGDTVDTHRIKVTGMTWLELEVPVFGVNDLIRVVTTYRCIGISHEIDPKTGEMVRIQRLVPVVSEMAAFDHPNGSTGVLKR